MLDPVAQVSLLTIVHIHVQGYSELHEMPLLALTFQKTKYYSLMSPVIEEAIESQCSNARHLFNAHSLLPLTMLPKLRKSKPIRGQFKLGSWSIYTGRAPVLFSTKSDHIIAENTAPPPPQKKNLGYSN